MRLFLLDESSTGRVIRAIVCAPDASGKLSDHAISLQAPSGGPIVLRQNGQAIIEVTENDGTKRKPDLQSIVVSDVENAVVLEVVYSKVNEVPAFSFLDEHQNVVAKKVSVQVLLNREIRLNELWSCRENIAINREFELGLRTQSIVASLVKSQAEMEENLFSDELLQAASALTLGTGMFLPLQYKANGVNPSCVLHLQESEGPHNFKGEMYWSGSDGEIPDRVDLLNGSDTSLGIAVLI